MISEAILTMWQECLNRRQYILTYQNSNLQVQCSLLEKGEAVLVLFLGTNVVVYISFPLTEVKHKHEQMVSVTSYRAVGGCM